MYKPYKIPTTKASPDVNVREPRVSKFIIFLVRFWGRLYLFLFFGIVKTILRGDSLVDAFKRALDGKSRCIIAFRHPNGGEPQLLSMYFLFRLRAFAKKKGIRFPHNSHAVFVYGYEVVRYGGWVARFIMPNLGAMPVHHSKMDTKGMGRIYRAIINGPWPVALSPEGQVSYTTNSVPRLEPGVFRIGFYTAQHLEDKKSDIPVEILPVSIHFRFGVMGNMLMGRLLRRIEKYCGFSPRITKDLPLNERLRQCRDYILEVNENRYNIKTDVSISYEQRLEKVIYAALETAERMLGIKSEGDYFQRLYKVRQLCWDRIFLPDTDSLEHLSQVQRSVFDLRAGEAWHIARHQELADFGWYFRHPVPTEETALHDKVEYIQNLWDFANRTMGGALSGRKNILIRKVIIQAGQVINLSERLPEYRKDKKAAVNAGLADLEKSFLDCIDEVKKMEMDYQ